MKHHYGACQGGPSCNCDDYDSDEDTPQNEIEITKDSNDACERIENTQESPEPRFPAHRVYRRVIGQKRGCEVGTVNIVESGGGEDEMMMGIYPS